MKVNRKCERGLHLYREIDYNKHDGASKNIIFRIELVCVRCGYKTKDYGNERRNNKDN